MGPRATLEREAAIAPKIEIMCTGQRNGVTIYQASSVHIEQPGLDDRFHTRKHFIERTEKCSCL
jgi:hypothetical protein